MTRETKIGLLVGLAFIIVVGILLSDQAKHAAAPPPAPLDRAGANVRQSASGPGIPSSSRDSAPRDVVQRDTVPTPRDLGRVREIEVIDHRDRSLPPAEMHRDDAAPAPGPSAERTGGTPPGGPTTRTGRIEDILRDFEPVGPRGPADGGSGPVAAARQYKAQEGDNLSRMATKFFGANTRANRDAIVKANASLTADPNRIIIGQTYIIPAGATAGATPPAPAPAPSAPAPAAPAPSSGETYYVTRQGDTLWGIATDQVGASSAVAAIKELNKSILNGSDVIRPNMKLRLPAKMVASAAR